MNFVFQAKTKKRADKTSERMLNRITSVQECDARMMKREQMPVTKNDL